MHFEPERAIRNTMLTRLMSLLLCLAGACACTASNDAAVQWTFMTETSKKHWGAVDAQRLYLCAENLYCLDIATGRLHWTFETFGEHASAPVIAAGRVFFQCGGLYALDAQSGKQLWEYWTGAWATCTPAATAERVYAPVGDQLHCLDAGSGKLVWRVKTGKTDHSPVIAGGSVFVDTGGGIVCIDASQGRPRWRVAAVQGRQDWRAKLGNGPLYLSAAGNNLFSAGRDGIVRCYRVDTGALQWQFDKGVLCWSPALPAGERLICSAGVLYCLSRESGNTVWSCSEFSVLAPQLLGTTLFIKTPKHGLYGVSLADGKKIWHGETPSGSVLLATDDGAAFFSSSNSRYVRCITVPRR